MDLWSVALQRRMLLLVLVKIHKDKLDQKEEGNPVKDLPLNIIRKSNLEE
jgi:hypothetical protein